MGFAWGARHPLLLFLSLLAFVALSHPCLPTGSNCASHEFCCSNACSLNEANPKCVDCLGPGAGTECTKDSQCCSGYTCTETYSGTNVVPGECIEDNATSSSNWYDGLYLWIAISVIISSAVIALGYMAGKVFEVQLLEAWAKVEISELATGIVIAVFCIGLIASVNASAQFLTGESGPNNDVTEIARGFLKDRVYADGKELYGALGMAYYTVAKMASYAYTSGLGLGYVSISASYSTGSGLFGLASQVGQGMDTVANFMLVAAAQSAFLEFFKQSSMVLLPVGIFLRCFSFTRKAGALVLAGAICGSVVYPSSVLVAREIYVPSSADMRTEIGNIPSSLPDVKDPPLADLVCNPAMQRLAISPLYPIGGEIGWAITICVPMCAATAAVGGFLACYQGCYQVISNVFYIASSVFPILMAPLLYMFGELTSDPHDYFDPIYDHALPAATQYGILSIITLLVPIIMTISLFRAFATAFGGEPQLYGLSKLI